MSCRPAVGETSGSLPRSSEARPRKMEPVAGIEPATFALRKRCSTAELHWPEAPVRGSPEADSGGREGFLPARLANQRGQFKRSSGAREVRNSSVRPMLANAPSSPTRNVRLHRRCERQFALASSSEKHDRADARCYFHRRLRASARRRHLTFIHFWHGRAPRASTLRVIRSQSAQGSVRVPPGNDTRQHTLDAATARRPGPLRAALPGGHPLSSPTGSPRA